ncbi:N-acetyltransferase [Paenibacillus cineris]|uniref:N-acetyltransferase n=2 Tax=Paenibacillus TaxID=44249 RepID=A0ABQ4L9R7_9BACL|nr:MULTISPECIES: GNAT family N-acetyltransferase [Paenibacillus]GIO53321.1 N-acetyltransferase [Paenibacillus cineris]
MFQRSITIREAGLEDLHELAAIFDLYRIFYGQETDVEGAAAFLFERIEHRESVILIAEDVKQGRIAGFTQLYPVFSSISMKRSYILNDLYIREQYRKQGIARLLLEAAKRYAKLARAKGLSLSTAVTNVRAQQLYEQSGYVRDEQFIHYDLTTLD